MSTKPNTTIDDIGPSWYKRYESDKTTYDPSFSADSHQVAEQLRTDAFMPLTATNEFIDYGKSGSSWSSLSPPSGFNEQKRGLFLHQQLAPKLGPEDLLDTLSIRITEKMNEELALCKEKSHEGWQQAKRAKTIESQGKALLDMVKLISDFNTMIALVEGGKYGYRKA